MAFIESFLRMSNAELMNNEAMINTRRLMSFYANFVTLVRVSADQMDPKLLSAGTYQHGSVGRCKTLTPEQEAAFRSGGCIFHETLTRVSWGIVEDLAASSGLLLPDEMGRVYRQGGLPLNLIELIPDSGSRVHTAEGTWPFATCDCIPVSDERFRMTNDLVLKGMAVFYIPFGEAHKEAFLLYRTVLQWCSSVTFPMVAGEVKGERLETNVFVLAEDNGTEGSCVGEFHHQWLGDAEKIKCIRMRPEGFVSRMTRHVAEVLWDLEPPPALIDLCQSSLGEPCPELRYRDIVRRTGVDPEVGCGDCITTRCDNRRDLITAQQYFASRPMELFQTCLGGDQHVQLMLAVPRHDTSSVSFDV